MILNNGTQTFDPIKNPGIAFRAEAHSGYSVTMTLHTANQSSQGNQDNGTTWYSSNRVGFSNGSCVYDIGPNEYRILNSSSAWNYAGWGPDTFPQPVNFSTIPFNQVTYTVDWYDPLAPQYLSATVVSSSQVNLNWSPPLNDSGSPIMGYEIQINVNDVVGWTTVASNTNSVSTTYSDTGLTPNTTYWYRVFAIRSDGTASSASSPTSATTNNSIMTTSQLQVDSQDNNGNHITGFYTELYADNGTQIDTSYTPASFTLNNGQSYAVHVEDYGNYIFDHWSDTGSTNATRTISISSDDAITAVYKTVPQAPTGLTATGALLKINLNWTAPGDNGGSSITGYMIERSNDGGSTWSTLVADTGNTGTAYSDTHVLPLKTYTYRVSAINNIGTGSPSNTASASILSVSVPSTPTLQ
jgi:hypothetical protein